MMKLSLLAFLICCLGNIVKCENILRYTEKSCKNLKPIYVDEDFSEFGLGPEEKDDDDNDDVTDEDEPTPKQLNVRNPPFRISVDFNQYRAKKHYTIKLTAQELFDSFMIQVQPANSNSGNMTQIGRFIDAPSSTRVVKCKGGKYAAVVNKVLPVQFGSMNFVWKAPGSDEGVLKVRASIAYKDAYIIIESNNFGFKEPLISVEDCGSKIACYRSCQSNPKCQGDGSRYIVTMDDNKDENEVEFKLGGMFPEPQSYVALGIGKHKQFKDVDVVTCSKKGNDYGIDHYFLENESSEPNQHKAKLRMTKRDEDTNSGMAYCQFKRPIEPENAYDLDLEDRLYHFYFWGKMGNNSLPIIPEASLIQRSSAKLKASTKSYTDVHYDPSLMMMNHFKNGASILSNIMKWLLLAMVVVVKILF